MLLTKICISGEATDHEPALQQIIRAYTCETLKKSRPCAPFHINRLIVCILKGATYAEKVAQKIPLTCPFKILLVEFGYRRKTFWV